MEETTIVVVTGASGVGKTTLVRALEAAGDPSIDCHYFDSIGVPSPEEMVREYGSGDAWQKAMTERWICRLHAETAPGRVAVLDGQTRPTFVRDAFAAAGVARGGMVLVDCDPATRHRRLTGDRGQPELASERMDAWAAYLRGQADALGLPVIDNSGALDDSLAQLRAHVAGAAGRAAD